MKHAILFENVDLYYGKIKALNGISFNLSENECAALIGNNGSGKTTTIHVLCNIISYHSGTVLFYGNKIKPNYQSYKNKLGIILSRPYFIDEFNVISYWKFVAKYQKVPEEAVTQRINDLTKLLNFNDDIGKKIKELSSGNQMKVSIGAMLIHNPDILIMDEPFINLDIQTIEILTNLLKDLKNKKTIFITSHHLDLVIDLCDKFLIIDKGKIISEIIKADYLTKQILKNKLKELLTITKNDFNLSWLK